MINDGAQIPAPLNEELGFDLEFFMQLLSERREKRMRNGVLSTRWVQTRERNEALDLACMLLCNMPTFRGAIDTMAVQTVGEASLLTPATVAATEASSRTKQPAIPYAVLPTSTTLAEQLGVQSQVAREQVPGQRRSWGVQPSSNIWDL